MDYLGIVLNGYFDQNSREHLTAYFNREFKKAESEFYEIDEFFKGCLNIINAFKDHLQEKVHKRKTELLFMKASAKDKTLRYEEDPSKSIEQRYNETISYCEDELKKISVNNFTVHLNSLTNRRYSYNMWSDEVEAIEKAIKESYEQNASSMKTMPVNKAIQDEITKKERYENYILKVLLKNG